MNFTPHYHSIGIATVSIQTETLPTWQRGLILAAFIALFVFGVWLYVRWDYNRCIRYRNDLNSSDNTTFEHDDNLGI